MDIREIVRQLREGRSDRQVSVSVGVDHKTVGRYRRWAMERSWLTCAPEVLPEVGEIERAWHERWGRLPAQNRSAIEPHGAVIRSLRERGLSKRVVLRELREHHTFGGSYSALCRYIRQTEGSGPEVTVRVETAPGEEAQVDFGYAGRMWDPATAQARKAWAFVMTLSWSRHMYVRFVFDQRVATWLELHQRAFEFFGGVPKRMVLDNLKAAIVKASLDDPLVQRAYRECAEHYGFLIAPCRVATPRHKGKVERGVGYVASGFLAGRDYTAAGHDVQQANAEVLAWIHGEAGQRIHGTTRERPLDRFATTEQAALAALPAQAYEPVTWTQLKLHRDGYVVFEHAYYSAPHRYAGQHLALRASARTVQLYDAAHCLVATHTRAQRPGQRQTNALHLPQDKACGLALGSGSELRDRAAGIGPHVAELAGPLLEDRVVDKRRTVLRLLRLADKHGPQALEAACQRAIDSGDPSPLSVRNWLKIAAAAAPATPTPALTSAGPQAALDPWRGMAPPLATPTIFARPARELLPDIAFAADRAQRNIAFAGVAPTDALVAAPVGAPVSAPVGGGAPCN